MNLEPSVKERRKIMVLMVIAGIVVCTVLLCRIFPSVISKFEKNEIAED